MEHSLRPIEVGVSQIRMYFDIAVLVEAAGFDAADQLIKIESRRPRREKRGLPAAQHRLPRPREAGGEPSSASDDFALSLARARGAPCRAPAPCATTPVGQLDGALARLSSASTHCAS